MYIEVAAILKLADHKLGKFKEDREVVRIYLPLSSERRGAYETERLKIPHASKYGATNGKSKVRLSKRAEYSVSQSGRVGSRRR